MTSTASPSARQLLAETAHRPWALPQRPWVLAQSWLHLLFAHWRVAPQGIAPLLPAGLELDTFDGSAWIGVVPFKMHDVHPRGTFNITGLSAFPELNVRTYVKQGGKSGVWFLSLDAANPVAVRVARRLFHLPYQDAAMDIAREGDGWRYHSERRGGQARFEATYQPISEVYRAQVGSLDEWLTERYCLYSADAQGRLYCGEITHRPWGWQRAEADISVNTMTQPFGITLPDEPPLLHYSERLDVLTWYITRVG